MIHNDVELKVTQERIVLFTGWVAQFRVSVPKENLHARAEGDLAESQKLHAEVMAYLRHHPSEPASATAA